MTTTAEELARRIEMIQRNLEAGEAGEWAAKGYDADAIARCKYDAGQALDAYTHELRAMKPHGKRIFPAYLDRTPNHLRTY